MRLDVYLAECYPERSRSVWAKLIRRGDVAVNGAVVKAVSTNVIETDQVTVADSPEDQPAVALPVIYEDASVVVINKPTGVLTHSKGALNEEFTVADFVRTRVDPADLDDKDNNRFGIVHRLDRATSGVLIAAKHDDARRLLQKQFAERKTKKTYWALVKPAPKLAVAQIDLPIARNPKKPAEFRVDPKGKSAITDYKTLQTFADGSALLELSPQTGRTHQLRVHLAHIGAPIVGDIVYNPVASSGRMLLHAARLEITIPGQPNNKRRVFKADLPEDFQNELDKRTAA